MELANQIYSLALVAQQRAVALLDEKYLDLHIRLLLCEYITYLGKTLELAAFLSVESTSTERVPLEMLLYATKECSYIEVELNLRNICFMIH